MDTNKNLSTTLAYELTNLPYKNVVQNFFVGSKYVYALQLKQNGDSASKYTATIYRTKISTGTKVGHHTVLNFSGAAKTTLKAAGHNQTLNFFKDKTGSSYFLTTTKPISHPDAKLDTESDKKYRWDVQLAKLQFGSPASYTGNSQLVRLENIKQVLQCTNDFKRVGGAVSADYHYLLIGGLDESGNGYFARYLIDEVTDNMAKRLNLGSHVTNLNELELEGKLSDVRHLTVPNLVSDNDYSRVLPQASVQGFEIGNDGAIYVSSGKSNIYVGTDSSNMPSVTKFGWNSPTPIMSASISNSNWSGIEIEPEGIQITNPETDMYICIAYKDSGNRKNRIYSINNAAELLN